MSMYRISDTVGTSNTQLIFWNNRSNKGISGIPIFAIFTKVRKIRDSVDSNWQKYYFPTIKIPNYGQIMPLTN